MAIETPRPIQRVVRVGRHGFGLNVDEHDRAVPLVGPPKAGDQCGKDVEARLSLRGEPWHQPHGSWLFLHPLAAPALLLAGLLSLVLQPPFDGRG